MLKDIARKVIYILVGLIIFGITINFNKVFASNYQNYQYEINSDNSSVTITGYTGSSTQITIPSSIAIGTKEYNVISISDKAFYGKTKLLKIIIPETVISIGNDTFSNCSSKLTIYVPNNSEALDYAKANNIKYLITYNDYAYSVNNSKDITLKEYIGSTSDVIIPSKIDGKDVAKIGEKCFYNNENIQNIVIPDTVTEIGSQVFENCINLKDISMPNSIYSIGASAFAGCNNLSKIIIPQNLTTISEKTFYMCTSLNTINIPSKIKKIDNNAFAGCSSLISITIPDNTSKLGIGIFDNCNKNSLKIYCTSSSKASKYAQENNTNYILQDAPRKLSIIQRPNKVNYKEGENFETNGMILQVTYNDGTSRVIDNFEVIDGENLRTDKNIITLSYTENKITVKLKCSLNVETAENNVDENQTEEEKAKEEPKIVLNKDVGTMDINGTLKFIPKITPEEIASKNVIWKSNDENIAKINSNGVVKGINIGATTITATTEDGKCTTSCEIMVVSIPEDYQGPVITIEVIEETEEFAKIRISVTDRENPLKNLMINDIDCTKNINEYNEIETKIYKNVDYEIITKDANGNISTFIYNYNNTNGEIVTCENGEILRELANGEGIDEDVAIEPAKSEINIETSGILSDTNSTIIIIILAVVIFGICVHIGVKIKNMRKI